MVFGVQETLNMNERIYIVMYCIVCLIDAVVY